MHISSIISQITSNIDKNYGIERYPCRLNDRNIAIDCFIAIANRMLAKKDKAFDYQRVKNGVDALIDWTYMLNDELDYRKGILLKGNTGRGKTFLLNVYTEFLKIDELCFSNYGRVYPLLLNNINAQQIALEYQSTGGYDALLRYSQLPVININDIGAEISESNHFGNKENVIERIIDAREERSMLTFGTTNLEKFSDNYDARTISRMNSLFNIVIINHEKDFRL